MRNENKSIVITSIICGVILIIALVFLFTSQAKQDLTQNVLTIQGHSTVKVTPDIVSLYFNIETKGNTSAEANSLNSEILKNFTEKMIENGFNEKDIKTENFNIYPNNYWENNKMKEDGFKATRSLKVELNATDFDKISKIIDLGVDSGAMISYINFELSQEIQRKYKEQAIKDASLDAKTKAEATASGFNKKLGNIISVQLNEFNYYPWPIYRALDSQDVSAAGSLAKESIANVNPSDQEVSASVSVTYKLK
jgi:uncharacterized protein YggE